MTFEIIPTVVPKSAEDVAAARKRYGAFAPSLHIDIADGAFAPNTTWTIRPGEKLPDAATANYEVHLMVENPLQAGLMFARAGACRIIGHIEAFDNAERARETFDMWQKAGAKETGIAILLQTPLEDLVPYASLCDSVLVMTIGKIGMQGAPFEERGIERVQAIRARYPELLIATDGGVSKQSIESLASAGASRFCIGSALAKAKDPAKAYAQLLGVARNDLRGR